MATGCIELQPKKKKMVPLENILRFQEQISESPKIDRFNKLIRGNRVVYHEESVNSDTDALYYNFLVAIADNNKQLFEKAYTEFSRKRPSPDSPWVKNDFLVFTLLCGIAKFDLDWGWIRNVLQNRTTGSSEQQALDLTFRNISNQNYLSRDNLYSVIIVFLDLFNRPQLGKIEMDETYLSITNSNGILLSKNDFLIVIALRAYDIIILSKETPDSTEMVQLKLFRPLFLERTKVFSNIIFYLIISLMVFKGAAVMQNHSNIKSIISDLSSLITIIGITVVGGILLFMKNRIVDLIKWVFGYSKIFND
jgi:hypothetical protein